MTTLQQKHRATGSVGTSIRSLFSLTSLAILLASWSAGAVAKDNLELVRKNRVIEFQDSAVHAPSGLAYSPEADAFFVGQPSKGGLVFGKNYKIQKISSLGDNVRSFDIWAPISNPINTAFDAKNNQLLILNSFFSDELIIVKTNQAKNLNPNVLTRHSLKNFGLNNPQGITLDPKTGTLYILNAADQQILVVEPGFGNKYMSDAVISTIDLNALNLGGLRGIAFNPENGHLYILNPIDHKLHELTKQGAFILTRDLTNFALSDSQGMVFAPSGDQTDDTAEMSLYIANTGLVINADFIGPLKDEALVSAGIVELSLLSPKLQKNRPLSLAPIALAASPNITATLVNTILTSEFDPVSPDPSGITYLPNGNLLESDGEVNEMSVYADANLFELTLGGQLVDTSTTVAKDRKHTDSDDHPKFPDHPWGWSDEPNGISSVNPTNNHAFFTDDDDHTIYEINPGSDGQFGTADDSVVSSIDTNLFSPISDDPEGIAFNPAANELFLAEGLNNEIYRIAAGGNGEFGDADDVVTHFDTETLGLIDPEGIEYNPSTNTLYAVGKPETTVFEITPTGDLVREIDISAALDVGLDNAAGLALAPGSEDSSELNLYIVDRGIDNGRDPNENDGKIYEFSFGAGAINLAPVVDTGSDQSITLPNLATLNGTLIDDGLPSTAQITWFKVSGPGVVTFANIHQLETTVSFSEAGVYTLRLKADDTELFDTDDVIVTVGAEEMQSHILDIKVSSGADDAEEKADSRMSLTSSDLEFVNDGGNQTIGVRFNGISIPQHATITKAYIQYQVDEVNIGLTSLIIEGEATDDAVTFTSTGGNISSRNRTGASVVWNPVAWGTKGAAGVDQQTSDISPVIQEIVNRSGWVSSNSLVIITTGTGERTAESFNGDAGAAPSLHIEYTTGPVVNQAPHVNAGENQSILLSNPVILNATVTDDGLENATPTTVWSKVSGPGNVTFANTNNVDTTATFSVAGNYILRLTADDGELTTADDVSVTVSVPTNQAPIVNAGSDQSITLPNTATLNATVTDDGLPDAAQATWTQVGGLGVVTFANTHQLNTTASFSEAGIYTLQLTADDTILSNTDNIVVTVSAAGTQTHTLDIKVLGELDDAEEEDNGSMHLKSSDLEFVHDGGNQTVGVRFNNVAIPQHANITKAYIQYQVDEVNTTPTLLTIEGEATDNALAFTSNNGNISSRNRTGASAVWDPVPWTEKNVAGIDQQTSDISLIIQEIVNRSGWVSNNSLVIITTGTGERTAESFDGDGEAAPSLHVEYSIGPVTNQAPHVNAGANQTIHLPNRAVLNGTVSDDGLPNVANTLWTKVSGPGTVEFGTENSVDTIVDFSIEGTYVLRLTADDTEFSDFDDLTIVVEPQGTQTFIVESRVSNSTDDAEERSGGSVKLSSSDLELVFDSSNQTVGVRFNEISIPNSATIVNAYIRYQADEENSDVTSLTIKGEASDDALTFSSTDGNISSRNTTGASVPWSPAAWDNKGEAGVNQETPNIASVIQEIINRNGWSSGNSLVIITTGTGERVAEAFDGDEDAAPLLYIEYR